MCPFAMGARSPSNTMSPGSISTSLLNTKWHLDASSRLATTEGGSPSSTMWPQSNPTPVSSGILIHSAVWPQYMGQNWGCCAPFGGAGSPSNTMSPGSRSSSVPSGILIHPAVWPQQTWAENWGELCPFWGGGAGSPSSTMWPQ